MTVSVSKKMNILMAVAMVSMFLMFVSVALGAIGIPYAWIAAAVLIVVMVFSFVCARWIGGRHTGSCRLCPGCGAELTDTNGTWTCDKCGFSSADKKN